MRRRSFGPTGVEVAIVGEGTWQMERDREDDVVAAIRASVDLGMDHVDTAELYGSGRVETMVGRATSGAYGYTLDKSMAVGYVRPSHAKVGTKLELVMHGERHKCEVLPESPWDPENARLRA